MVPKLTAAIEAARAGIPDVRVGGLAVLEGAGTRVAADPAVEEAGTSVAVDPSLVPA
jgi:hypothetical protein